MEEAKMIAAILGPMYLVLGLSLLMYMPAWQKLMKGWQKDHFSLFGMMLFVLVFGLYIVNSYNVWEWNVWLIVTIVGWGMVVKSAIYFLLPGSVMKSLLDMKKNSGMLYLGGLVAIALGAALSYFTYFV